MVTFEPSVTLNNGKKMPMLGIGTYQSAPNEVRTAVEYAIDIGYRHIDTAYLYENEAEVGDAVRKKISEGKIKREDVFICTKLWSHFFHPSKVMDGIKKSLSNLNLGYIDLFLLHSPVGYKYVDDKTLHPQDGNGKMMFEKTDHLAIWKLYFFIKVAVRCFTDRSPVSHVSNTYSTRTLQLKQCLNLPLEYKIHVLRRPRIPQLTCTDTELEKAVDQGIVKAIGLSNFNKQQIQPILDNCRIKPANLQVECHAYFMQKPLFEFCKKNGISFTAYGPLGAPERPTVDPKDPVLLKEPKLQEIANRHHKSPAQVLNRYLIQCGRITIPKSVKMSRIKENFEILDFTLTPDDLKQLDALDKNLRLYKFEFMEDSEYYPFSDPY